MQLALVAIGRPVRGEFTYAVPESLRAQLEPGVRLKVPFGRRSELGFFLAFTDSAPPDVTPKPIEQVLDARASLTPDVVELLRFAARHYRYPLGEAMRSALPPGMTKAVEEKEARPDGVWWAELSQTVVELPDLDRAPQQHAVLSYLLAVGNRASVEEIAHAIDGAKPVLKKLSQKGVVKLEFEELKPGVKTGLGSNRPLQLTEEQAVAVATLEAALDENKYKPFLLHGVTGSGKTEVYLRLVERALEKKKGSLVLVPEIALTPQLVGRFRTRFGPAVAVLHSALKDRERLLHWQRLRSGELRIAVGVRSAIWAPLDNLGVLVVDEEHDPSFKQDDKLRYQARDLAVVRAQRAQAVLVLGSATPSLETLHNTQRGRYELIALERRVDDRPMPKVELLDMRIHRPKSPEARFTEEPDVLSQPLRIAIAETLDKGQQVILFLNRRGHATFLTCEVCGQSLKCDDCDICLTHHLSQRRLVCHLCGKQWMRPKGCPSCSGELLELGIGTERVEAEVGRTFPGARMARLDRDAVQSNERLTEMLASFARREIDVLIGTQMVAKGHDFPGVTLVCVVLAETALSLPDFRAAERTFHLLTQVAGRAGRGKDEGRVLVQSYHPEAQPVAHVLGHDYRGFADGELVRRKQLFWPPFSRMASVRIEGPNEAETQRIAHAVGNVMGRALPAASLGVRLLGPAPAPLSKVKGQYRWQLLVKAPTHALLNPVLDAVERFDDDELPNRMKLSIDVDPGALL